VLKIESSVGVGDREKGRSEREETCASIILKQHFTDEALGIEETVA
jgi:hypothetical protein